MKTAYTVKDKEVKRSPRIDRTFVDNFVHEAEQAASYGEMNSLQNNKAAMR